RPSAKGGATQGCAARCPPESGTPEGPARRSQGRAAQRPSAKARGAQGSATSTPTCEARAEEAVAGTLRVPSAAPASVRAHTTCPPARHICLAPASTGSRQLLKFCAGLLTPPTRIGDKKITVRRLGILFPLVDHMTDCYSLVQNLTAANRGECGISVFSVISC